LLLVGVPIYIRYSPKKELAELKQALTSRETVYQQVDHLEHNFLAHLLYHIKRGYRRLSARGSGGKKGSQAKDQGRAR
jgi:hypothetical protein